MYMTEMIPFIEGIALLPDICLLFCVTVKLLHHTWRNVILFTFYKCTLKGKENPCF